MRLEGYYSSGQFARLAQVSVRTIRFYDKQNILKPSLVNENGARFYTDSDLARLQQILLLKYLGFSLDEIREMTIDDADSLFLQNNLQLQRKLIQDRIEQMQMVEKAIEDTAQAIESQGDIDWKRMLELIHLTNMEKSLASQYRNATNVSARIRLHHLYSKNKEGWFPWVFSQCAVEPGMQILELGCGSGALWCENLKRLPDEVSVLLSDISEGMVRDARRNIGMEDHRFSYAVADCHSLPFEASSFDMVIANHVLFYCSDLDQVFSEISRVLKNDGRLICSTYGKKHMLEMNQLIHEFDERIFLSADRLYEIFGLENGMQLLEPWFSDIQIKRYEDELLVDRPEPLIEYILSCHGNQNQYLLDHYKEFRAFTEKKTSHGFHITKDAGIFSCKKI